jgi:hypothetical protein
MPELIQHDGLRFLSSRFSEETYEAWLQKDLTPKEIQKVINHIHISTLLQGQEVSDEAAAEAAKVIGIIWRRTLGADGPEVEVWGRTSLTRRLLSTKAMPLDELPIGRQTQ